MKPILVRHGIRQKRTRPGWIHDYKVLTYRQFGPSAVHVDTEKYQAGANPIWNHLKVNPEQSRSMLVEYYGVVNAFPGCDKADAVAHSNGCNVTIGGIQLAAEQGQKFGTVILIGGAIHSDIEKSGVLQLVESGAVEKFIAYVSPDDRVIRRLEDIPYFYGSLGSKGFHHKGKLLTHHPRIKNRFFRGFRHSEYFTPENISNTTNKINSDIGLIQ